MSKKIILFITLFTSLCFGYNQRGYRNTIGSIASQASSTSRYSIPLSPAQINNQGYVTITHPGNYFITENFGFYPTGYTNGDPVTNNAIIYINSDNVVLNLGKNSIYQKTTRTMSKN